MKTFLVIAGIGLAAVLIFRPWAGILVKQEADDAVQMVKNQIEDESLIKAAREALDKKENEVRLKYGDILQAEQKLSEDEETCDADKEKLAFYQRQLLAADDLLAKSPEKNILEVEGKQVSRADVEEDMQFKKVTCDGLEKRLPAEETNCGNLAKSIKESKDAVYRFKMAIAEKRQELDSMERDLANKRLTEVTNNIIKGLASLDVSLADDPVLQELNHRMFVGKGKPGYDNLGAEKADKSDFNYTQEKEPSEMEKVQKYIDSVRQKKTESEAPAAPVNIESVPDAPVAITQ